MFLGAPSLEAPKQIDAYSAEVLAGLSNGQDLTDATIERVYKDFPKSTRYDSNRVTFARLETVQDVKNAIRGIFRINKHPSDWDKERRDVAFEYLKQLNELYIQELQPLEEIHKQNLVTAFKVGQVVQHKHHRWRGVIVSKQGANTATPTLSDDFSKTSLTNKIYKLQETSYQVAVDTGDVYRLAGSLEVNSADAVESDLELVEDPQMLRIRNEAISDCFDRFCGTRFIPNSLKSYEYPQDASDVVVYEGPELIETCNHIVQSIQNCAKELEEILVDVNKQQTTPRSALTMLWRQLKQISAGMLRNDDGAEYDTKIAQTMHYLRFFMGVSERVFETTFQRERSLRAVVKFQLGDVIAHKKFGFRGLVVAWDPEPAINVSQWDGLKDIEDPLGKPFYRVLVDRETEYYGNSMRYVCEDNMELSSSPVNVDLDDGWTVQGTTYFPPENARFAHGEDMGDDKVLEETVLRIREKINDWQISVRSTLLPSLVAVLHRVGTDEEALTIQEAIQEFRKANNIELRRQLEHGTAVMVAGRLTSALDIYNGIIKEDPDYSMAWEKLGNSQYLAGSLRDAALSTKKSLELENSSTAMNTLGMIEYQRKNYDTAEKWFRESLKVMDPWSVASSRLSACIDLLNESKAS